MLLKSERFFGCERIVGVLEMEPGKDRMLPEALNNSFELFLWRDLPARWGDFRLVESRQITWREIGQVRSRESPKSLRREKLRQMRHVGWQRLPAVPYATAGGISTREQ